MNKDEKDGADEGGNFRTLSGRENHGLLIIFEGIDGAGKTTQAIRVTDWLKQKGLAAVSFSEPTRGVYGQKLREIILHGRGKMSPQEEMDLFLKDREEDVQKNILPALRQNYIVIMDRYYHSNMAYQGALGIDSDYIRALNEKIAPKPDMVIILDLDVRTGLHRINTFRREKENYFEKEDYLKKVSRIFSDMQGDYIHHIPASLPLEEVNARIDRKIMNLLHKSSSRIKFSSPDKALG
ncbi:MAG: dTMP kinase [bacterium]